METFVATNIWDSVQRKGILEFTVFVTLKNWMVAKTDIAV